MKIKDILFEYIKAYHGASEHGARRIGHAGTNSNVFGSYGTTRYGIFLSSNPKFAAVYGEVLPYAIGLPQSKIPDLSKTDIVNQFYDWAWDHDLRHVIFFFSHQYRNFWELFEEEIGKAFYEFAKEKGIKAVKFQEHQTDNNDKEVVGVTYVVFDVSVLKRDPDPNQLDLFLK
jgi:hypothetical protein